ncbi:MAG TPA: ribonuclease domain-containing protein [Gemmataceae bacterium]|nr:ribonuclease domain-containing protein [Gemmataceae bacterium]
MRCNACGIVFDGEISLSTSCMNKHCPQQTSGGSQFSLVGDWAVEWGAEGDQYTQLALTFRQMTQAIIDQKRTVIQGVAKISYKKAGVEVAELAPWLEKRDLVRVLERISQNIRMPPDVYGRQHQNWGTSWKNQGGVLPVTGNPNYYGEFGVDVTVGPSGERHFTGERIVIGRCREFYYTSHHYGVGSWWVYNSGNGQWNRFER